MRRNFREHRPVSTVVDFLKAVQDVRRFYKKMPNRGADAPIWFRGQHCLSWTLTPKIYRPEFRGAYEPDARELFQSRAIQLLHGRQPTDEWEWYFLMQHHGAPTRLLDWTENPLIGLYFAVKNHTSDEDATVWLLDPFWLNRQNSYLTKHDVAGPILSAWHEARLYLPDLENAFAGRKTRIKYPAAIEAPHVDVRLHAQASRFVVFGLQQDLSQMFDISPRQFGFRSAD